MEKNIDWLNLNMLTINVSKTNYMIMTAQGKGLMIKMCHYCQRFNCETCFTNNIFRNCPRR